MATSGRGRPKKAEHPKLKESGNGQAGMEGYGEKSPWPTGPVVLLNIKCNGQAGMEGYGEKSPWPTGPVVLLNIKYIGSSCNSATSNVFGLSGLFSGFFLLLKQEE
ncbi:hypothetical protein QE152_g13327 [Popillia japonica]|uniref:Uncharacterized protein n=1 Tax=Popillia japonica TaxID=7064 RepID=A0AAW1LDQ6_POPJA